MQFPLIDKQPFLVQTFITLVLYMAEIKNESEMIKVCVTLYQGAPSRNVYWVLFRAHRLNRFTEILDCLLEKADAQRNDQKNIYMKTENKIRIGGHGEKPR